MTWFWNPDFEDIFFTLLVIVVIYVFVVLRM